MNEKKAIKLIKIDSSIIADVQNIREKFFTASQI